MSFCSWRFTHVPLLNACHKALHLAWVHQNHYWIVDGWKHVTWSDESHFQLYWTDGHVQEWREPHESIDDTCQQGSIQSGGTSVIVWGIWSCHMRPLKCLETTLTDLDNFSRTVWHPTHQELLLSSLGTLFWF